MSLQTIPKYFQWNWYYYKFHLIHKVIFGFHFLVTLSNILKVRLAFLAFILFLAIAKDFHACYRGGGEGDMFWAFKILPVRVIDIRGFFLYFYKSLFALILIIREKMKNTKTQKYKRCENVKSKKMWHIKKINAAFEHPKKFIVIILNTN